ncbi:MAG TPA: hypothetical protein VF149_07790, partial [Bacillales bacterium]
DLCVCLSDFCSLHEAPKELGHLSRYFSSRNCLYLIFSFMANPPVHLLEKVGIEMNISYILP